MKQFPKYEVVCTRTYDPCYGFKLFKAGQTATIEVTPGSHGIEEHRIVRCDNGEHFPNWGMKLDAYELETKWRRI